ncbi:MAG TPA: HDOD domain-containing protein [Sulfurimonas sp.]|nr:HDOD domain-containing protein [Sulfurimonas sp.]
MHHVLKDKIQQLPSLPESAIQLEAIYHDPNSSFEDMVKVLEMDPLLTADILKSANSPLYGFTREINSINQAVGLFGMGTIRGFALAVIVKKSFPLDLSPYDLSNAQFSNLSKMQHALAVTWYLHQKPTLMDILSPASFLIEIGKVMISQYLLERNKAEDFKKKMQEGEDIKELEMHMCDSYTAAISADIFNHWKFDENLVNLIRCADSPQDCLDESICEAAKVLHVIRVSTGLDGVFTDESLASAKELIAKYELDLPSFEAALEIMSA